MRIAIALVLSGCIFLSNQAYAQEKQPTAGELIVGAWQSKGAKDFEATMKFTQQLIDLYEEEALAQQSSLSALPKNKPDIQAVQTLNDVGTSYFIQGEAYRDILKDKEKAIEKFKVVVYKFCFAQAWDPRGWYWKVALAAWESIEKLDPEGAYDPPPCPGILPEEDKQPECEVSQTPTKVTLHDPGTEDFVDYSRYGAFKNVGTENYAYEISDQVGLIAAVGEGVYPNTSAVRKNPAFKQAMKEGRLQCNHWDYIQSPDREAAFLKWATAPEPQGVRLFYTALILEKAGLIKQAIKAYYSIVVHFPGQYGWTYWHTPWYVGQAAIAKIKFLLRRNPWLGYRLEDAYIKIVNGFDNDISNDKTITWPGRFVKVDPREGKGSPPDTAGLGVRQKRGGENIYVVQYETGDWQLIVDGQPYIIKGITYAPTKIGQSPDEQTLGNWMEEDFNGNGRIDGPYDAFYDKNRNERQDEDEPGVGDFLLMKLMGVNTIRLYHHPLEVNKELLRDLYETYGIRVIMGDFLGKYALGSGAPWNPGTDYHNEEHKKNMLASVEKMVREFKDEPYILFWLLGNENVYGYACNADKEPEAFFSFANEVARRIKEIDPDHPVALCSGDVLYLDIFGKNSTDIDMFGTNAYRGEYGFGFLWRQVREEADIPAFITEFGCPAYAEGRSVSEAEFLQAEYHRGAWEDIELNMAFAGGAGNAIGGVVFEWLDEWWKGYEPSVHDTRGLWAGPFPDGYMHEEWLGVSGQGKGQKSPFLRQLRKAYFTYKRIWR
ncbi:MAG: hypothetical protein MJA29_06680 [Candidatus Omnitrophica bacterium]|nr:hypothetical protein [Candidatus Omnitrophota bacterium]